MIKINKIINIALIFMIVISAASSQLTYADERLCLRGPIEINKERMNVAEDFFVPDSTKALELRRTMLHDIKNISEVINKLLYDEKVHSEDFNKVKNSLFLYIGKLYEILENYNNINWELDFKNTFNEFINDFDDDVIKILCKELDKIRSSDLKDFIAGIKLFYKSFVGNDPIKDVDLENLFEIVKTNEARFPYIIFNFKSQETAKHIIGREGETYRAFLNLVRNGVEAIERKMEEIGYPKAFDFRGHIEINVYSDKGYSVIEISDDGPGMSNEALEAFRNRTVYSSKGELGGRGLKAARNIIERNNGTIDVESKPGKGTIFTIKLLAPDQPRLASNETSEIARASNKEDSVLIETLTHKRKALISIGGKTYFIKQADPSDYDRYQRELRNIFKEEDSIKSEVAVAQRNNWEQGMAMFFIMSEELRKNLRNNTIWTLFLLLDDEENIIGASVVDRPNIIPEVESKVVTMVDAVRFKYQNRGLGTRLREIIFGWLMHQGSYTLAAEIVPYNKASKKSLGKVLEKLNLRIRETIPSIRDPSLIYIIQLPESIREAI